MFPNDLGLFYTGSGNLTLVITPDQSGLNMVVIATQRRMFDVVRIVFANLLIALIQRLLSGHGFLYPV